MHWSSLLIPLFGLVLYVDAQEAESISSRACRLLNATLPGLVAFPGSPQYQDDIAHYAISSDQNSTCTVEPSNVSDVTKILQIVGRDDIRSPFAVKGSGHIYTRGFSSTLGVQISMKRFNSIIVDGSQKTVTIGMGLSWDQVYAKLEPMGFMVIGGRVPGVGVGGLSLGGGYSWKTNQYGLTIDNIVAHDLVLPSGDVRHVTNRSDPDIFFALKGGGNNFGIVTSITMELHPQTNVFGGSITYAADVVDQVHNATAIWDHTNTDPKAQISIAYSFVAGQFIPVVDVIYDAPSAPSGTFDVFLNIPSLKNDVKTRTFVDYVASLDAPDLGPFGATQHMAPVLKYTVPIMKEMEVQITRIGTALSSQFPGSLVQVSCFVQPFSSAFAHNRGGAYPHPPSRPVTPTNTFIAMTAPIDDRSQQAIAAAVKDLSTQIQTAAVAEGQSRWDDILYPNYALPDTPLKLLYGQNVARLTNISHRVDPKGIMRLAGGFKFGQ